MKTKLFTLLLAVAASVGTMYAWDYERVQIGDLYYNLSNTDKTAVVTYKSYSNYTYNEGWNVTNANIPASVTYHSVTYSVTSIGWGAFYDCRSLTSVTIPNSVTSIGSSAFYGCTGLTSVTIPNSVTTIGSDAFDGCTGLTSVVLNSDAIVSHSYSYNNNIKNIFGSQVTEYIIGNSVTSIGDYAFYQCTGLTSVTIPNSVISIGDYAFGYCTGLTSVTIPNSVTSIGNCAFYNCSGLTSVCISDLAAWCAISFGSSDANPLYYAHNLYLNNELVTDLIIPNSVTSIGSSAFYGCTGLTSVTIPNSVTTIGSDAFHGCTGITSVTWNAINSNACNFGNQVESFIFGNTVEVIPAHLCEGMSLLTSVILPTSITTIGDSAFASCSALESVYLPNSVTSIGDYVFAGCDNITMPVYNKTCFVKLPTSYSGTFATQSTTTKICGGSCKDCLNLASFIIANSVTSIGDEAFANCTSLGSTDIPNSITTIGQGAFKNTGVSSMTIPNSITAIAPNLFSDCSALTTITLHDGITNIGNNAFHNCSSLLSVTIPELVTTIEPYTFANCSALTSITIPKNITTIATTAFSGCGDISTITWNAVNSNAYNFGSQVSSFTFGNEVEVIPASLCQGMSLLNSINIPNSVTSIGNNAFSGCSGLTSVMLNSNTIVSHSFSYFNNIKNIFGSQVTEYIIGNSVTSIGDYAFYQCTGLTSVTIGNSVTSIGDEAFSSCSGLTSVHISNLAAWCAISFRGPSYNPMYYAHKLYLNDELITNLVIPNNVTSIGNYAIAYCDSLTSVTIPNSVTSIGNNAFYNCTGLTSVEAPAMFFDVPEAAWPYYTKILNQVTVNGGELTENELLLIKRSYKTLITLDVSGVTNTEFADEAFSGYYNLTELRLPEHLTSISYMMAAGCKNLESITIPESVEEIDQSAFEDCRSITAVDFGENPTLTKIGNWAFYNCHELVNIDIPEGVTEIGKAAFYGCAYAQAAHMPASLQYIGDNGFALCSKLTEMTVDAVTPPEVENKTFYEVSTEAPVYVPDASVAAYKAHPIWGRLNIIGKSNTPTDIENTNATANAKATKILRNGQIYILRGEKVYTLQGQEVK